MKYLPLTLRRIRLLICPDCGCGVPKKNKFHLRCSPCAAAADAKQNREREQKRRAQVAADPDLKQKKAAYMRAYWAKRRADPAFREKMNTYFRERAARLRQDDVYRLKDNQKQAAGYRKRRVDKLAAQLADIAAAIQAAS